MPAHAFSQIVRRHQLDCLEIRHPLFHADVLLQGAQLIHFQPTNEIESWIWLSEQVTYEQGKSLRGGIPICWPWFGDADKNLPEVQQLIHGKGKKTAHGFARNELWQLQSITEDTGKVCVQLTMTANNRADWHGQAELTANFDFSAKGFQLSLTTRNLGERSLFISQALHSYFPTDDIKQSRIYGLEGCRYQDALQSELSNGTTSWRRMQQQAAVGFNQEVDRVYYPRSDRLRLQTPSQITTISSKNSQSCIVWNPWINKSKRLSQFDDAAYQRMLCIETANVMDDQVQLAPGESQQLTLTISR